MLPINHNSVTSLKRKHKRVEWNSTVKDLFDYLIAMLLKLFPWYLQRADGYLSMSVTDPEFSRASAMSVLKLFRHLFNVLRLLNNLIILNILTPRALMSVKIYTGLYKNCII